ncbi:STN domain-containing protein [Pantoea ananatis]|uniref:STN domain-containing protein n=1 Tax=Pantoea ananas TaxID=553 RepID=UPI000F88FE79|nr:STN domain-containing protein [Pantoea ananatis]RQN06828.1 hypothetical protein EHQ51_19075 [Pantoea ananatis]
MNSVPLKCLGVMILAILATACSPSSNGHIPLGKCDVKGTYSINFPRFDETAQQLAHASGCFIETDLSRTGAVHVNPVQGTMTIREAVSEAIKGTSLTIVAQKPDTITVE